MAWIDGVLTPQERAGVPVSDRGFLYGDAVFETVGVRGGRPFLLEGHLRRLEESAEAIGIGRAAVAPARAAVAALLAANRLADGVIRLTLTRGSAPRGLATAACGPPRLIGLAFQGAPPAAAVWRAVTTSVRRADPATLPAAAKTGCYLPNILAYRQAEAAGADEALMRTPDGLGFASGSFTNLFALVGSTLLAPGPAEGALPGLARALALRAAARLGVPCEERAPTIEELRGASELFLTNSVLLLRAVSHLDGAALPAARPLAERLRAAMDSHDGRMAA